MKSGVYVYEKGRIEKYICARMFKDGEIAQTVKSFLSNNQDKKCVYLKNDYIEIIVHHCPAGSVAIIPNCPPTYDMFKDCEINALTATDKVIE